MPIVINANSRVKVSNDWLQLERLTSQIFILLCCVCSAKETPGISFTLMTVAKMVYTLHCHFRRCIFRLDWKMNNCLVIYYATPVDAFPFFFFVLINAFPYLIEGKSLKLKAVLGWLMVLNPDPMNSLCYYQCRLGEVYYASDAPHGTYETLRSVW